MELHRGDAGGCAVLRLSGAVLPEDAPRLREAVGKAMADRPTCLVCDLSEVSGLAPVCVAVLVAAQWTAPWPGPVVWLVGAHGQPAEALAATGAPRFLAMADSVPAALTRQDSDRPRLRDRMVLAPTLTSPSRARRFTEEVLTRWQVAHVAGDAMLVVSELVTNGVQHAGSGDLELRLELGRDLLQIAVRDRGVVSAPSPHAGPPAQPNGAILERGRGLEIVRTVADGSGHSENPAGGSVYWATLRTGPRRGAGSTDDAVLTDTIVVATGRDAGHPDDGWTARLRLTWRPDDPQYVTLTLSATAQQPVLPGGRWQIRCDSLRRALTAPVMDNDVEMLPLPEQQAVLFDLHAGGRVRNALVPGPRVAAFLDRLPIWAE